MFIGVHRRSSAARNFFPALNEIRQKIELFLARCPEPLL